MDCSPPGFSVHGILQARILEWVVMFSSRGGLPSPGFEPTSPALASRFLYHELPGKSWIAHHQHEFSVSLGLTLQTWFSLTDSFFLLTFSQIYKLDLEERKQKNTDIREKVEHIGAPFWLMSLSSLNSAPICFYNPRDGVW